MKGKKGLFTFIYILSFIALLVCSYLLVDILWIKPSRSNKTVEEVQDLYKKHDTVDIEDITPTPLPKEEELPEEPPAEPEVTPPAEPVPLEKFYELLELNSDVKGWVKIEGTNVDYPVVQSSKEEPEFYLNRNINKEPDSYGTIFIDTHSSIEAKNILLHGHNMRSKAMFHHLTKYNDIEFLKENPYIEFDTIFEESTWKVFAVFKTNGSSAKEPLFDYRKNNFSDDLDFLEFVNEIRVRSIYDMPVDIEEEDQILLLSTCSYEVDDYRTVVAARKIRKGEEKDINPEDIKKNPSPLYPSSWYKRYGGSAPKIADFREAFEKREIPWYKNDKVIID